MRIHSGLRCIGCGIILIGMRDVLAASLSFTPATFTPATFTPATLGTVSLAVGIF